MEKETNYPLVTVAVITYNSSRFILETLESIKNQSYKNIELIIADDYSKDNTVMICEEWIATNKSRFYDVKLVTTENNTGTAGNCNRALRASTGEWFKIIAGDDVLCNDAIENYIKFVNSGDIQVCFAEAIHFSGELSEKKFTYEKIDIEKVAFGKSVTAKDQYNILKRQFIGSGPAFFAKKEMIVKLGGYDERFPLQEDYPLFIKIAKAGYRFYVMPEVSMYKRNHSESVSHQKDDDAIITRGVIKCIKEYKYKYKYEELNWLWKQFLKYSMSMNNIIIDSGNTRKSKKCMFVYRVLQFTDPFLWYSRYLNLKDKMIKE